MTKVTRWPITLVLFCDLFYVESPLVMCVVCMQVCCRYPGFLRVFLQDPQPDRRFMRRGWLTFDHTVNIKEICWNLNNIRVTNEAVKAWDLMSFCLSLTTFQDMLKVTLLLYLTLNWYNWFLAVHQLISDSSWYRCFFTFLLFVYLYFDLCKKHYMLLYE